MFEIGITEQGDASLNFSWVNKLKNINIIISKNVTDKLIKNLINHKDKIIFHCTCTGFGNTILEPNIPKYNETLNNLQTLIKSGFPSSQIVLRIDPIIPTEKALRKVENIIIELIKEFPNIKRVRFSFIDMYKHVIERFHNNNVPLPFSKFSAPKDMINNTLKIFKKYDDVLEFESCGEYTDYRLGCISFKDTKILGYGPLILINNEKPQRKSCLCAGNKVELLNTKKQCSYRCLYCYWKD